MFKLSRYSACIRLYLKGAFFMFWSSGIEITRYPIKISLILKCFEKYSFKTSIQLFFYHSSADMNCWWALMKIPRAGSTTKFSLRYHKTLLYTKTGGENKNINRKMLSWCTAKFSELIIKPPKLSSSVRKGKAAEFYKLSSFLILWVKFTFNFLLWKT